MKLVRTVGMLAIAAFALTACDDDNETTGVVLADLSGEWTATQFEYEDVSGRTPAPALDAIDFGGEVSLSVSSDGSFTGVINVPNLTPGDVPISGDIDLIDNSHLSITFDAETLALVCPSPDQCLFDSFDASFTLNGDTLTFVNEDTTFDFAPVEAALGLDPAGPVDATLTVTLVR